MPANLVISVLYIWAAAWAAAAHCSAENDRPRAATTTLAPSRFTSSSNGAGSVSSKSFTSNTSRRSREAEDSEVQEVGVTLGLSPANLSWARLPDPEPLHGRPAKEGQR